MSGKILVIGSSNVDFTMKMDRLPRLGETVTNAIFMQTFGGKGANQAVGAARAGGEVIFVSCVGDDLYGQLIIENLAKAGVHTESIFTERGVASGAALIMVGSEGQNYLSVAPGANYRLTPEHIEQVRPLIETAEMIVLQYEILPETLRHAIQVASEMGKMILLNLAPARPIDKDSLSRVYTLVVNETEAEFLAGDAIADVSAARRAAQKLLALGPRWVIITLGAQGCHIAGDGQAIDVPALKVQAVDTTAAGDIFCGTLAVALVEGKSMEEATRFASTAAAISTTRLGAQPSAPNRAEIEQWLASPSK